MLIGAGAKGMALALLSSSVGGRPAGLAPSLGASRLLARRRAELRLELSDGELYEDLRKAVGELPDPELRRELTENTWEGLRSRFPVSNDFLEAMREIEEEKRLRRRKVSVLSAWCIGVVVVATTYVFVHRPELVGSDLPILAT